MSCSALAIALREAGLADQATFAQISRLRIPRDAKIDPELPESLNPAQRSRKEQLLERGLSDHYVALCFEAHSTGVISQGRLAEALLCSEADLLELRNLYGLSLHDH